MTGIVIFKCNMSWEIYKIIGICFDKWRAWDLDIAIAGGVHTLYQGSSMRKRGLRTWGWVDDSSGMSVKRSATSERGHNSSEREYLQALCFLLLKKAIAGSKMWTRYNLRGGQLQWKNSSVNYLAWVLESPPPTVLNLFFFVKNLG